MLERGKCSFSVNNGGPGSDLVGYIMRFLRFTTGSNRARMKRFSAGTSFGGCSQSLTAATMAPNCMRSARLHLACIFQWQIWISS